MARQRPVVVSTRAQPEEAGVLRALAELERVSVAEVVHRLLIPAARARLAELARPTSEAA
jgi:PHD/YefM family antitoxin component YafN of YafNO toxin-antitoxin module